MPIISCSSHGGCAGWGHSQEKGQRSQPLPEHWCHSPSWHKAQTPTSFSAESSFTLSRQRNAIVPTWVDSCVSQFSANMLSHIEINSPAAPCCLVWVRVRGQVLSHGRHNSPNDWQVDTRAELWLWLPMRLFGSTHCANRTRSSDSVHMDERKKIVFHSKHFIWFLLQVFTNTLLTSKGL